MPPLALTTEAPSRIDRLDLVAVHRTQGDFIWCSLQRLGVGPSHLEDVFQEVFVVVHKRLHTFDGSSQLRTWLFGICLRVAAAHRRKAWFRRVTLTDDEVEPRMEDGQGPDDLLAAMEARLKVQTVLDRMDVDKRAVFVMFEIDGLPTDEIAGILGVPVGTVYSRLHLARKQFQTVLQRLETREKRGGIQ